MADANIIYDDQGHARHFNFARDAGARADLAASTSRTPQDVANAFLQEQADVLKMPLAAVQSLGVRAAIAPTSENQAVRFDFEKRLMDSTIVNYTQTMFGLPIYQAGVSVTIQHPDVSVKAATSTLHYDIAAQSPGDALTGRAPNAATVGGYDDLVRKAIPAATAMRINRTRLMVYQYTAAERLHGHKHGDSDSGFHAEPPALPLPPVPASIVEGKHYIAVEALFSLPLPNFGMVNWRAFVEPESGAVLYLRALLDGVTGLIFERDPITKTGSLANLPSATSATLNLLRDNAALVDLGGPVGGQQSLAGSFVKLAEISAPTVAGPTTVTPFNFAYVSRTNDFAAANAYYHCDRFFRTVQDAGFNVASYFSGTAFPFRSITAARETSSMRSARETRSATGSVACSSRSPTPAI
jgi:hypothetical protein